MDKKQLNTDNTHIIIDKDNRGNIKKRQIIMYVCTNEKYDASLWLNFDKQHFRKAFFHLLSNQLLLYLHFHFLQVNIRTGFER